MTAAQDLLLAAPAEAERANAAKDRFLSRLSHELRTPLNAVLGFGQLLELTPLAPEQDEAVDRILAGGRHLLSLIDDLLDVTQIGAGHVQLSLLGLMRPTAAVTGIRLNAGAAHGCVAIAGDSSRCS